MNNDRTCKLQRRDFVKTVAGVANFSEINRIYTVFGLVKLSTTEPPYITIYSSPNKNDNDLKNAYVGQTIYS